MQLWEKESNEIFKVKNLCIYASVVLWLKNIPGCTLHQSKPCCWAKMETLQTKQNFVAERVETLHFAVWTNENLARDEKLDLLHFWHASKVKSNMVLALTSPLTGVNDVAKYIISLLTPLTSVKVKSNW